MTPMLTLICGLPRSGKTTISGHYKDTCEVLHCDYLQPHGVIRKVKEIADSKDIAVEGIYRRASERKKLLEAYTGGGKKVCLWLNTPQEVRETRTGYHKASNLPFEPPTLEEGWDEVIINRNGEIDFYSASI